MDTRILIVDDERQVADLLKEVFSSWSMSAESLTDPLLVSREVKKRFYHIVLLDIMMPKKSGLDVLAEISRLSPKTKIIMMTGYADKEVAIKALRLGAFDFLEKPMSIDLLSYAVKRALETQRIELEHEKALEDLKKSHAELLAHQAKLEQLNEDLLDTNKALSVLAQNIERTREETERRMVLKIRSLILPIIEKLRQDKNLEMYEPQFAMLVGYIEDLTSGLATNFQLTTSLSFSELRIASMIRNGMTSEEIARQLHIALDTVKTHRRNIRRKLNITGTAKNLRTYLGSLER